MSVRTRLSASTLSLLTNGVLSLLHPVKETPRKLVATFRGVIWGDAGNRTPYPGSQPRLPPWGTSQSVRYAHKRRRGVLEYKCLARYSYSSFHFPTLRIRSRRMNAATHPYCSYWVLRLRSLALTVSGRCRVLAESFLGYLCLPETTIMQLQHCVTV